MKPIDTTPHKAPEDEPFLQRFHRRKVAARRGEPLSDEPPSGELATPAPAAPPGPEPLLTDEDMPPIESLTAESDFSGFLSPGVSEDLRRAALRRLWQVADLDFVDELDIYAGDYTRFEPLGDLVTREMSRRLERAVRREAERLVDGQPTGRSPNEGPSEIAPTDTIAPDEEKGIQQMTQRGEWEEKTDAG